MTWYDKLNRSKRSSFINDRRLGRIEISMTSVSSNATRTLVVWVVIATLSGLAAMLTWRWTVATADSATHTLLMQQQLAGWLSAAQDLENGERGYLLTKDESYLDHYRSAKESIDKIHTNLKELVSGNSEQLAMVESIGVTLRQRLAAIEKVIADFSSGNSSASAQAAESTLGLTLMDKLREQIAAAKDQEERLFNQHVDQFQRQSFWLLGAVLATLIASAALAMVALIRERQRTAALEISALALASTNRMLEDRVKERTEELAVERDHAKVERERAEALLRDVTHRIGNTLALVAGFINLHVRHTSDPVAVKILTGARERVQAIASAQRRISVTNDLDLVRIDTLIPAVMADLVSAASEDRIKLSVNVPPAAGGCTSRHVTMRAGAGVCGQFTEARVWRLRHRRDPRFFEAARAQGRRPYRRGRWSGHAESNPHGRPGKAAGGRRPRHQNRCVADASVCRRDFL